ncbi:MAG: hypothetical protein IJ455_08895 [Agathobacter sp.]|nr:hypothetical protein [Agathobacter sp.]
MREENRSEIIHDALNLLDDEMIEEVEKLRGGVVEKTIGPVKVVEENQNKEVQKMPRPWRKWTALAASVSLLILVSGMWYGGIYEDANHFNEGYQDAETAPPPVGQDENIGMEEDVQEDIHDAVVDGDGVKPESDVEDANMSGAQNKAVTIPALKVNLKKEDDLAADMVGLFIYEGRCYVQTCEYMAKDVIGEYVCTTTGLIDEWTEKDGYVELAGSFAADIYTVKGVDSEFMLCTVYDDGVVETFTHNNGISINRGNEILEWLGFEVGMENYAVFCSKGNACVNLVSEEALDIVDKFFANFSENEAILRKDISASINDDDIYHLTIVTEEGVPLRFELLGDSYVSYYGLDKVCVKLDTEVYKRVITLLEN